MWIWLLAPGLSPECWFFASSSDLHHRTHCWPEIPAFQHCSGSLHSTAFQRYLSLQVSSCTSCLPCQDAWGTRNLRIFLLSVACVSSTFSDKIQSMPGLCGLHKNMQTHRLRWLLCGGRSIWKCSFIQSVSQLSLTEQLLVINTGIQRLGRKKPNAR